MNKLKEFFENSIKHKREFDEIKELKNEFLSAFDRLQTEFPLEVAKEFNSGYEEIKKSLNKDLSVINAVVENDVIRKHNKKHFLTRIEPLYKERGENPYELPSDKLLPRTLQGVMQLNDESIRKIIMFYENKMNISNENDDIFVKRFKLLNFLGVTNF